MAHSAAARALGVTHGAVSQQLRGLEHALQTQFFTNEGRRLQLTESGRALAPQIQRAFDNLRAAIARPGAPSDLYRKISSGVSRFLTDGSVEIDSEPSADHTFCSESSGNPADARRCRASATSTRR